MNVLNRWCTKTHKQLHKLRVWRADWDTVNKNAANELQEHHRVELVRQASDYVNVRSASATPIPMPPMLNRTEKPSTKNEFCKSVAKPSEKRRFSYDFTFSVRSTTDIHAVSVGRSEA